MFSNRSQGVELFLKRLVGCALGVFVPWTGLAHVASAADIIMSLNSSQSTVSLSVMDSLFGASQPQAMGSDTTDVFGHFLVNFDPLASGGPTAISFTPGDGSSAYGSTAGGADFLPSNQPANFALRDVTGTSVLSVRDLSWDWTSPPLPLDVSSKYASSGMSFTVLTGADVSSNPNLDPTHGGGPETFSAVGFASHLTNGTSQLVQTSPGIWQLTMNFGFSDTETTHSGLVAETSTKTYSGTMVATAQYGATNMTAVAPATNPHASVLGGTAQPGGVSATFSNSATEGTFSAQQIPLAGLSTAGVTAANLNHAFGLSLSQFGAVEQIWSTEFTGQLNGPVTLVFDYDPSRLPANTDQTKLGIWHFVSSLNQWQFGGTVDVTDHTISFTTTSLSPFALGVPEPSTMSMLACGCLGLLGAGYRRWSKVRRNSTDDSLSANRPTHETDASELTPRRSRTAMQLPFF